MVKRQLIYAAVCVALTACGDPLSDVPKLSDVTLADDAAVLEAAPAPDETDETGEKTGFLQRLLRKRAPLEAADDAGQDTAPPASETASEKTVEADGAEPPEKPRGLFSWIRSGEAAEDAATPAPAALKEPPKRMGLFGSKPDAGDLPEAAPGAKLAFGVVARTCGAAKTELGKEVARYPERGAKYRLYDSQPGATGARPFYLTGLKDGCARQVTAALVVFGHVGLHEQVRYLLPETARPFTATDTAYEKVKSRVCHVARGKPCGGKLARLEKDTVFLTAYQSFGDTSRWLNLLLHDGQIEAQDVRRK